MKILSLFKSDREQLARRRYSAKVAQVNSFEGEIQALSDEQLQQRVQGYRGKSFAEIEAHVPEIFAVVREGAKRVLNMRHFDVQVMGGLALLDGTIAEMRTGEGKTLVATLPLTVHGLTGQGAHLVTVNDYLAQRDANWMRPIYEFFGLTVGVVMNGQTAEQKRAAYAADVTYGTNNEFGFDYLRDNMAQRVEDLVGRELKYAIIDEVDSILIDEARTPLIISAPDAESTKLYEQFASLVPGLQVNVHYNVDEKRRAATLTEDGVTAVEKALGIQNMYEEKGVRFVHHLEQALRATTLYHRDKDYVVQEGQVVIVDEFTGRLMPGRRYSEGLHQAIEAKERVQVQQESRTLATITFQNFFRLYDRIGGMTGTAVTSAEEFEKVYNLDVMVIPTNKTMVRNDRTDKIYMSEEAKFRAIVNEIKERHAKGQPVLVGTIAIEKSERLAAHLRVEGVPHEVLNAKHHAREAEIISKAGEPAAVTISTNMAGRGTDIKLGAGVSEKGGLFVLGTERHEARRIDNQLRGRSGRQGDPGETQFFVCMDDDVMRIFGGERMKGLMTRLKVPEDEPIENRLVSRAIEGAQERVEGYYFDMRKQVLSYDDVLNRQRNAIYTLRRSLLTQGTWKEPNQAARNVHDVITELLTKQAENLVELHAASANPKEWNVEEISEVIHALTNIPVAKVQEDILVETQGTQWTDPKEQRSKLTEKLKNILFTRLTERGQELGQDALQQLERAASLRAIDTYWMDHLDTMDYLRTGIGLRGYGQRDPLIEYQREGHRLFQGLIARIKETILDIVFKAQAVRAEETRGQAVHPTPQALSGASQSAPAEQASSPPARGGVRGGGSNGPLDNPYKDVGRNDPCPCGSGLKYKKCGLINAPQHKG